MRRHKRIWLLAFGVSLCLAEPLAAQNGEPARDPLLARWVGHHLGRPLFLDFYGDSLLVVNDEHVLEFEYTWNRLTAYGDTTFSVGYQFALDRLLITTEDGTVVTMAPQSIRARPIRPQTGGPADWVARVPGGSLELRLSRNGSASWRQVPNGGWQIGRWNRSSAVVEFVWPTPGVPSDSTVWVGTYDNPRAIIIQDPTPDISLAIFRRRIR